MFNPQDHLTIVDGAAYLEVKWRLVWLRELHPDAVIDTNMAEFSTDHAVFRAQVSLPGGGSASGWGSEFKDHFANFVEAAETKAIGRALAALGFGTQFAGELGTDRGEHGRSDASVPTQLFMDAPVSITSRTAAVAQDATGKQRYMIGSLQQQLTLSEQELDGLAEEFAGTPMSELTKTGASSIITELKRRRENQRGSEMAS